MGVRHLPLDVRKAEGQKMLLLKERDKLTIEQLAARFQVSTQTVRARIAVALNNGEESWQMTQTG